RTSSALHLLPPSTILGFEWLVAATAPPTIRMARRTTARARLPARRRPPVLHPPSLIKLPPRETRIASLPRIYRSGEGACATSERLVLLPRTPEVGRKA